jgi:hypothetical protein
VAGAGAAVGVGAVCEGSDAGAVCAGEIGAVGVVGVAGAV